MVNTLLTELDGLDERREVYVIAATNRPDMIDPALCRPGRLDKLLYVDLPSADERVEIISTITRKLPLGAADNVDEAREALRLLVHEKCDGYSGADLSALVREAGVAALKRVLGTFHQNQNLSSIASVHDGGPQVAVTVSDFQNALSKLGPSVSATQRKRYNALRNKFAGLSLRIKEPVEEPDIALGGLSGGVTEGQ